MKAGTDYHVNGHSIDRLLSYAGLVPYQLPDIFPQKTEEEKRLFNLLQKAYIDTPYKKDYKISHGDLICQAAKAKCIHEILSDVGKDLFNTAAVSAIR